MFDFTALELRKNRLLFVGLTGAFFVSLPLMALAWLKGHHPAAEGIDATLLFWTLCGLPGAAVLFGASSGGGLASRRSQDIESPLPLSPRRRAAESLLAAAIHLTLLAVVVLVVSFLVSPAWRESLIEPRMFARPFLNPLFKLTGFTLAYGLILSFLCAYAVGHAVMGGLIGAGLAGVTAACLACGLALEAVFDLPVRFHLPAVLTAAGALGAALACLPALADWVERRAALGALRWSLITCALALGAVGGATAFTRSFNLLLYSLTLNTEQEGWFGAGPSGVLLSSLEGRLLFARTDGTRTTLLEGEPRTFRDFLANPHWNTLASLAWDRDGRLWVLVRTGVERDQYALWMGKTDAPLKLYARLPPSRPFRFARRGDEIGLLAWGDKQSEGRYYASIPIPGAAPRWQPTGPNFESFLMEARAESGEAARLIEGGLALEQRLPGGRRRRWALPGRAQDPMAYRAATETKAGRLFLVPILLKDNRQALAVCRPDGSVSVVWEGTTLRWDRLNANPQGALWGWESREVVCLMTPEGRFLGPLNFSDVLRRAPAIRFKPELMHSEGADLWLADPEHLLKIDAQGSRLLRLWSLSAGRRRLRSARQAVKEGLFYQSDRRLHFIDWNGVRRDLGPA